MRGRGAHQQLTSADFIAGPGNGNKSAIDKFTAAGYSFATNATSLKNLPNDQRALGLFTQGNLSTWLDQHVYTDALQLAADPCVDGAPRSS